jgi:hypothetical protein
MLHLSGRRASDGDQPSVMALLAEKRRVGEASSSKEVRKGEHKKAVPLLCHLKPQGRSLPNICMTAMKTDFVQKHDVHDDASELD